MTCAQALAIAAAALVFAEPGLPMAAYRHVQAAFARIEVDEWRPVSPLHANMAALPDRHCMSRGMLML
jgi:hypothetical protein